MSEVCLLLDVDVVSLSEFHTQIQKRQRLREELLG